MTQRSGYLCGLLCLVFAVVSRAADWPMLGRDATRNAVSVEQNPPAHWQIEKRNRKTGELEQRAVHIKWKAELGPYNYSTPIVANGKVWIGSTAKDLGKASVRDSALLCFDEATGTRLYEYRSPQAGDYREETAYGGIGCSPLVEGQHLWFITNRAEAIALDLAPLAMKTDPAVRWKLDMRAKLAVQRAALMMGPPRTCSIAASLGNKIYITTGHGRVYSTKDDKPLPVAPSLLCVDKNTGEVLWSDHSPPAHSLFGQFASPLVAQIDDHWQVIVPQGDGWVRSFDADNGKPVWWFDMNAKDATALSDQSSSRSVVMGTPVLYEQRVYVTQGAIPENGAKVGRLVCLDPSKKGDVSAELIVDRVGKPIEAQRASPVDAQQGERAVKNPNTAVIWEFQEQDLNQNGKIEHWPERIFGTLGSVAIKDNLLVVGDLEGLVHCLDARTGAVHWTHDQLAGIWNSPLIVDDTIYVANDNGEVAVYKLSAEPSIAMRRFSNGDGVPWSVMQMDRGIYTAPIYANNTLYVATEHFLYAIAQAEPPKEPEPMKPTGNWPQWRGPARDNLSGDQGLLQEWPEAGPPLLWQADNLGDGIATVSIADGRVTTQTSYGGVEYAIALNEVTGDLLWITPLGKTSGQENLLMRWLSQRSPTIDGARTYVYTQDGTLRCLRSNTGAPLWQVNYVQTFGQPRGKWGYCDKPLVDGQTLLCTPGGNKATVVALDKNSGNIRWKTLVDRAETFGYASPIVMTTAGRKQYVVTLSKGVVGLDAEDGHLLWRYDGVSSFTANSYTPLVFADGLLCANGYGTGVARLQLSASNGGIKVEEVYRAKLSLDPFEDSSILVDHRIFVFGQGGLPCCIDARTGKSLSKPQRGAGTGKAAATYADGRLYARWSDGVVALLDASTAGNVEKGRFVLPEPRKGLGVTFPVVTGGRLFVRDNDRLYCYNVRKQDPQLTKTEPRIVTLPTPAKDTSAPDRVRHAIFVPTPGDVVQKMLEVAGVSKDDCVYDLGSGDGRILIAAAQKYRCKAIGIELDAKLVQESQAAIDDAKLNDLVTIKEADFSDADLTEATVIAAYLYPSILESLTPKLSKLKAGTRIVTHQFTIPGYQPDAVHSIESKETGITHSVYLWSLPLQPRSAGARTPPSP